MSYDLYLFRSTKAQTNHSAANLFEGFVAREGAPGPDEVAFMDAFLSGARAIEGLDPGEPWLGEFETSADGICLHLAAGAHSDITELIISLADRHGFFLFDPQMREIVTGPGHEGETAEDLSGGCTALMVIFCIILVLIAAGGYWLLF